MPAGTSDMTAMSRSRHPVPRQHLAGDRMLEVGRLGDVLRDRVLQHDALAVGERMADDEDPAVDRERQDGPVVCRQEGGQVGPAAEQADPQGALGDQHGITSIACSIASCAAGAALIRVRERARVCHVDEVEPRRACETLVQRGVADHDRVREVDAVPSCQVGRHGGAGLAALARSLEGLDLAREATVRMMRAEGVVIDEGTVRRQQAVHAGPDRVMLGERHEALCETRLVRHDEDRDAEAVRPRDRPADPLVEPVRARPGRPRAPRG